MRGDGSRGVHVNSDSRGCPCCAPVPSYGHTPRMRSSQTWATGRMVVARMGIESALMKRGYGLSERNKSRRGSMARGNFDTNIRLASGVSPNNMLAHRDTSNQLKNKINATENVKNIITYKVGAPVSHQYIRAPGNHPYPTARSGRHGSSSRRPASLKTSRSSRRCLSKDCHFLHRRPIFATKAQVNHHAT